MYQKILAPLDGSNLSECSLEHTKEIATGCHSSEVVLLTAIEQIPAVHVDYGNRAQIEADIREKEHAHKRAREAAEKYLEAASDRLAKMGVAVQTVVIQTEEGQSVADVILNYADSNGIDLIVMSTHGRSGITRWAFGSVADRVVRHSKIPVLTVAPAGCRR